VALPLILCLVQQQPADEPPTAWSLVQNNAVLALCNRHSLHFDHGILLAFVFSGHRVVFRVVIEDAELVQSGFRHGDEKHIAFQLPSSAPVAAAESGKSDTVFLECHDMRKSHPSADESLVQIIGQPPGVGGEGKRDGGKEGEEGFHATFVSCCAGRWQETLPRGFALRERLRGVRTRE